MTLQMQQFRAALRDVLRATTRTEAEIVNKALKDVAFRSAQFTPKVTRATVIANLKQNGLLPRLAAASCNRKFGQGQWTIAQHRQEMADILKRRGSGVGAVRAGWIPAIQRLGGSYRGAKLRPGSTANDGRAVAATIRNLTGMIENAVVTMDHSGRQYGAGEIPAAVAALQRAVEFVTRDRREYAERRLREALS